MTFAPCGVIIVVRCAASVAQHATVQLDHLDQLVDCRRSLAIVQETVPFQLALDRLVHLDVFLLGAGLSSLRVHLPSGLREQAPSRPVTVVLKQGIGQLIVAQG